MLPPRSATVETWRTDRGRLLLTDGMVGDVEVDSSPLLVRRIVAPDNPIDVEITFILATGPDHLRPGSPGIPAASCVQ